MTKQPDMFTKNVGDVSTQDVSQEPPSNPGMMGNGCTHETIVVPVVRDGLLLAGRITCPKCREHLGYEWGEDNLKRWEDADL